MAPLCTPNPQVYLSSLLCQRIPIFNFIDCDKQNQKSMFVKARIYSFPKDDVFLCFITRLISQLSLTQSTGDTSHKCSAWKMRALPFAP